MAPALTQASEPLNLAETTRHNSSPFFGKYKCLKLPGSLLNGKPFANGERFTAGLAPPVFRGAECQSPPAIFGRIMEESPALPNSESGVAEEVISPVLQTEYTPSPESPPPIVSEMGCHTNSMDSSVVTDLSSCNPKAREAAEGIFGSQQNDLLNFMGREFDNVSDIIDTLQSLASNPALLDAAESELASSVQVSDPPVEETLEERAASILGKLAAKQSQLQRKKDFLLRRLRRVSARGLAATVSSQLDYLANRGNKLRQESETAFTCVDDSGSLADELHADSMRSMTTSDLVNYVRKVEASQNKSEHSVSKAVPPSLPETLCLEADYVVAEMKAATLGQVGHDSDATESSSGGESCDELETFQTANYKPIQERAFYKYSHNRGFLASKWAWLRAQIADLDYKITQQEKVYTQLRSSKGDVTFIEECANGSKVRKFLKKSAIHDRESPLTCITPPSMRFTVNGYHPAQLDESGSSENSCARTLSVSKLKRRRYVRPSVVLRRNKRSYNGSSLSLSAYRDKNRPPLCCCVAPLTCVLCTNLQSNSVYNVYGVQFVRTRELASLVQNRQNVKEKLAKVDPSFHSVLSNPAEMLQNEAYTNSLNLCCFREKPLPVKEEVMEDDTEEPLSKRRKKDLRDIRRRRRDGLRLNIENRRYQEQKIIMEEDDWEVASPTPDFLLEKKEMGKSRNESNNPERSKKGPNSHKNKTSNSINSYDIDNIVIPQSMASISLVETLHYKEITTPKWRIYELSPLCASSLNDSYEIEEDISEESFKARHAVSEEKERKYFRSIQLKANKRFHRSRRGDSSGTNTPDQPMSPRPLDNFSESSPIGSPLIEQSEDSNHSTKSGQSINNNNTVLSLSLSAIQSFYHNDSCLNGPNVDSDVPSPATADGGIVTRSHGSGSNPSDKFFRPITPAPASQDCEKEFVVPFPCRNFPLNVNECDTLKQNAVKWTTTSLINNFCDEGKENVVEMKDKSGCESPLSEVTDSAPEEDDCELDDSSPHWTIRAVKDGSGACMLQVQRN